MKKKYFLLREADSDNGIVGVVEVVNDEELNNKVLDVLNSHFDADEVEFKNLVMEDYEFGRSGEFKAKITVDADDYFIQMILINEVFLF